MPSRSKKKKVKKKRPAKRKSVKKRGKKTPRKRPTLKLTEEDETDVLDRQTRIWDTYARVRSILLTAEALGVSVHMVRSTLAVDRARHDRIKQDAIEKYAARWEQQEDRALTLLTKSVSLFEGDLLEIELAIKENRITTIRNEAGFLMPVLNARQLINNMKIVDQLTRLGAQARAIASALRAVHKMPESDADPTGLPSVNDFSNYTELQLAQQAAEIGLEKFPETTRRKCEHILEQARKSQDNINQS